MSSFDSSYDGTPPWDIKKAQNAIVNQFKKGKFVSPVLDIGCGTGDNALYLADQGLNVTGIDSSPKAIKKAKIKSKIKGNPPNLTFLIQDLFSLSEKDGKYKTIIDIGVFHIFNSNLRTKYQEKMFNLLETNGRLLFLVFNDKEPLGLGPPYRISRDDIYSVFNENWEIEEIVDEKFEHNFDTGYAHAYLAIIKKI